MNTKWILSALGVVVVMGAAPQAIAQKRGGAETSLVGIKLYDTGVRVVSVYGTPDQVQAVGGGGNAIGPGGGGGGPAGGARGGPGGPGGVPPGRAPAAGGAGMASNNPGDFGDTFLQRSGATGGMAPPPAPMAGDGGGGGGGAPGGGSVGNAGSGGRILYTRWVYNRNGSKYGFVLDRSNRVVQIEAIGLTNSRVKTARGITFGSTFAQLIKKYNQPDGYEINGDSVVVRFLVRNKVAFRLSRLGPNKPQVVTGIVVAAGKT